MIKVVWLTNYVIPAVARAIGINNKFVNEGWITQMFEQLTGSEQIKMTIICDQSTIVNYGDNGNFSWFTINGSINEEKKRVQFRDILKRINPDVIHVWGSEYPHTETMLKAAADQGISEKVVISLQGIIYAIANHYQGFLPVKAYNTITLHDILRNHSLKKQEAGFHARGESEKRAFRMAHHVIGRTEWDRYCVERINENICYHHCNETLRKEFYSGMWEYNRCVKHSIFISQASYPIKGLHIILQALPKLIKKYPDLHVYIAGADIVSDNSFTGKIKRSGYGKYLRCLINTNNLWDYLSFLGPLDAKEMKKMYLEANVFVCPSVIENSPNSVGEAMILGCPVICSYVGGVPSIFNDGVDGLTYPADDYYMLEKNIDWVFEHPNEMEMMCKNARVHAFKTHNANTNFERVLEIYNEIINIV